MGFGLGKWLWSRRDDSGRREGSGALHFRPNSFGLDIEIGIIEPVDDRSQCAKISTLPILSEQGTP